jgi:hypothetical protein
VRINRKSSALQPAYAPRTGDPGTQTLPPYFEALRPLEFWNLLGSVARNKSAKMTLEDRLQKCIYFTRFALHLQLNPAIDQIFDPANDFVASRQFLDTKSKSHPLNSTFVDDPLGDHKFESDPSPIVKSAQMNSPYAAARTSLALPMPTPQFPLNQSTANRH